MTVRDYKRFYLTGRFGWSGLIYEHDYEERRSWRRLPGKRVVVGAALFPLGNGQSILRRRVFAGLSADG